MLNTLLLQVEGVEADGKVVAVVQVVIAQQLAYPCQLVLL
jgi:hypothetical protein